MEKEQPPDSGDRDLNISSTDDKIRAYEAVANAYHAGTQPAVFLTHGFLQDNPILLEEGCLSVNWDRIPGLYSRIDQMLMVSITDAQWDKWGQPGGWTVWEPDTRFEHFRTNLAVVLCKGVFDDTTDPLLMGKVCHYMTIAQVPDCVELLPFNQVHKAFNRYNEAATGVGLVRLHQSNEIFPDVYFQYYGEHFMIMGLSDAEIQFGMANKFVGGYLVCRHVAASSWRAQTMLHPGYVLGATHPIPSPMYMYHPGGTGSPGQHPPIHAIFLAPRGQFIASPGRFCIAEAPASEWPFNDAPVPWILPEGYRNPKGSALDFLGEDSQDEEDFPGKGSGTGPLTVSKTVGGTAQDDADKEDDEGFITLGDNEEAPVDQVLVSIPVGKVSKLGGSGLDGKDRMFESDDEDDAEVQEQIKAVLAESGPLDDLQLSESEDESESDTPDDDDDGGDPNETKQYYQGQEDETAKDSRLKPDSSTTIVVTDPPVVPGNPGKPDDSNPGILAKENQPTKPIPSKGKGPSRWNSSKAPASKSSATTHPLAAARGVQERAQSTLLGAAASIQAMGNGEDTVRRLENYTGLLTGLQNLVVTMAGGYEEAAEDIRALVASTLDEATQQDRAFVARASQALANWTEKYQLAMSQGENQSLHNQLAHWDQVRQAGVTLSQKITSLTTDYEPGTTSSEIFQALLPDCFCRIRARTEATFHELHATLPTLLCQFVAPDQAGQMLSAIFTCMCNYNTEICGMAMAQAVVLVYTIPNTYRVQQSLWEGICRIIPGIAHTSRSELRSFEPAAPHNTPVEKVATAPAAGSTGVSSSTHKNTAKEARQTGVPLGIPPAGSV